MRFIFLPLLFPAGYRLDPAIHPAGNAPQFTDVVQGVRFIEPWRDHDQVDIAPVIRFPADLRAEKHPKPNGNAVFPERVCRYVSTLLTTDLTAIGTPLPRFS